jgi:GxxExxY protein
MLPEKREIYYEELTRELISSAMEVHRHLGPGLLESVYEECFCHELKLRGISFKRQVRIPLQYKGMSLNCDYRLDVIAENKVLLELKSVDRILPIHHAQLLTYLRLSHKKVGLIINFNTQVLRNGIKRLVL